MMPQKTQCDRGIATLVLRQVGVFWSGRFWNEFPEKLHLSYKKDCLWNQFPKMTLHVFVCDSENYMEKCFGNYFLGKSHVSYINKVLGVNFAMISGWSLLLPTKLADFKDLKMRDF